MNESQKRLDEKRQLRIRLENISIVLLAVFSFFLFLLTFFPFSRISQSMQASFEMGRMVQRAFSIVLFVLSLQLWKRKRNAWMIAMGIFTLNFLRGLIGMGHPLHNGVMIFDLVLFLLFFCPAEGFLYPGRTREPEADRNTCFSCHCRCPDQCRDHLALHAGWNRCRILRLLCGQFRPGHRHDLRNGRSSCFHGRPSWNRICPFLVQLGLHPRRHPLRTASMASETSSWSPGDPACQNTFKPVQPESMFLPGVGR